MKALVITFEVSLAGVTWVAAAAVFNAVERYQGWGAIGMVGIGWLLVLGAIFVFADAAYRAKGHS
jgi:hypothetical protein